MVKRVAEGTPCRIRRFEARPKTKKGDPQAVHLFVSLYSETAFWLFTLPAPSIHL